MDNQDRHYPKIRNRKKFTRPQYYNSLDGGVFSPMKWNEEKNSILKSQRGFSFDDVQKKMGL